MVVKRCSSQGIALFTLLSGGLQMSLPLATRTWLTSLGHAVPVWAESTTQKQQAAETALGALKLTTRWLRYQSDRHHVIKYAPAAGGQHTAQLLSTFQLL